MTPYTANIIGSRGGLLILDILAADMQHARELARQHGAERFGCGFTFTVREAE